MKRRIRLTESELRNLILENVSKVLEDIDIDPKNKGKFTATQKRTGKSTEELCHSKNKKTRQRANFARMAKRGWKPLNEAVALKKETGNIENVINALQNIYDRVLYQGASPYEITINQIGKMIKDLKIINRKWQNVSVW